MKNPDDSPRSHAQAAKPSQSQSPPPLSLTEINNAKSVVDLTKLLIADAEARAKADHAAIAQHSPLTKLFFVLMLAAILASCAIGAYGIYRFPDAPIRPVGNGFVSKAGKARTAQDYADFLVWQKNLFIAVPLTILFGFTYGWLDSRDRKRHGNSS